MKIKNYKLYKILFVVMFLVGVMATGMTCVLFLEQPFFTLGAFLAGARTAFMFVLLTGIVSKDRSAIFGVVGYLLVLVAACFIFTEATKIAFLCDDNLGLLAIFAACYMTVD